MGGSSPLARGLRHWARPRPCAGGIIPARAGFTIGLVKSHWGKQDHPRSRGVYAVGLTLALTACGSSPLARGLHSVLHDYTHMGMDHPRSRGVYRRRGARMVRPNGSSPLARGLRSPPSSLRWPAGIIPARAGFTHGHTPPASYARDHPRSRGVYLSWHTSPSRA